MDKRVIILFGPPGAGKGTQAELLAEKLSLYYLEPSKILEEKFIEAEKDPEGAGVIIADGKEYKVSDEKDIWVKGILCSPPFVTQLVLAKIQDEFDMGKSILLAGSPRTVYEAEKEMPFLKELFGVSNIKAVLIDISPEQTIHRNSNRRICELMRHPILFNDETKDLSICPLDGSKLMKRKGLDDVNTIKTRLEEYKQRTFPLFEVCEREGVKIKKVNGEQTVEEVYKEITEAIK